MIYAIFYLAESSVALLMLYCLYYVVLRKEKLFQFNRFYLLTIPAISLMLPALSVNREITEVISNPPIEKISELRNTYYEAFSAWEWGDFERNTATPNDAFISSAGFGRDILTWIAVIYFAGLLVCLSRTAWTLRWIRNLILNNPARSIAGLRIVILSESTSPFSFFNYVFVRESMVGTTDFELIVAHERIHAKEKHSIDSLIVQLMAAIFWFNPVIWRLMKSLKATHEYIADHKVINAGYSATAYQILLLRQLISNNSRELVHNFNLSFIKQRITMMKHKKSGWAAKTKLALTIVTAIIGSLAIVQCNSKFDDDHLSVTSQSVQKNESLTVPVLPASGFRFKGDLSEAPRFRIVNDVLTVNGETVSVDALSALLDGTSGGREIPVVIEADKDQTMEFIRHIHMALRKADRRKLLYLGSTTEGNRTEVMLVLPPDPDKVALPDPEKLASEGEIDLFKVLIGSEDPQKIEEDVYSFVKGHIARGSEEYVISAKFNNTDSFNDYLRDTYHIREAFYRIYQERSHEFFGKDFFDTDPDEYKKAREGVPMSISIAEE